MVWEKQHIGCQAFIYGIFFSFSSLFQSNTGNNSGHRASRRESPSRGGVHYASSGGSNNSSPIRPVGDPNRREREALGLNEDHQRAYDFMRENNLSNGVSDKTRRYAL